MELFSEQIRKQHIFAKMDARVKFAVAIALLIMVLSYNGYVFPLIVLFLNLILCIKIKIPLRLLFLRFFGPLFIASMVVILKFLFTGKELLLSINLSGLIITGYIDGLLDGLKIASRILGAVSIIVVLGVTTPFTEIISALSWFKIPRGFVEVLMFAYRYIFVLFEDAMVIYNAQKNRLGYSNIMRGLRSFGVLTGSLILKAFEHSQNITTAMIQRGYDGNMPVLKHKPFKPAEIIVSNLFLIIMGLVWKI